MCGTGSGFLSRSFFWDTPCKALEQTLSMNVLCMLSFQSSGCTGFSVNICPLQPRGPITHPLSLMCVLNREGSTLAVFHPVLLLRRLETCSLAHTLRHSGWTVSSVTVTINTRIFEHSVILTTTANNLKALRVHTTDAATGSFYTSQSSMSPMIPSITLQASLHGGLIPFVLYTLPQPAFSFICRLFQSQQTEMNASITFYYIDHYPWSLAQNINRVHGNIFYH